MTRYSKVRLLIVVILLFLPLGGCFLKSDVPLISQEEAITPLPAIFMLGKIDQNGRPDLGKKMKIGAIKFVRKGKVYEVTETENNKKQVLQFTMRQLLLPGNHYVVQRQHKTKSVPITYYIVKISKNALSVLISPHTKFKTQLASKSIGFKFHSYEDYRFSTKSELMQAAEILANNRGASSTVLRYRILKTASDIKKYVSEAEKIKAKAIAKKNPLVPPEPANGPSQKASKSFWSRLWKSLDSSVNLDTSRNTKTAHWIYKDFTDPITDRRKLQISGTAIAVEGSRIRPVFGVSCKSSGSGITISFGVPLSDLFPSGKADLVGIKIRMDKSSTNYLAFIPSDDWTSASAIDQSNISASAMNLTIGFGKIFMPYLKNLNTSWKTEQLLNDMSRATKMTLRASTRNGSEITAKFDLGDFRTYFQKFPASCK